MKSAQLCSPLSTRCHRLGPPPTLLHRENPYQKAEALSEGTLYVAKLPYIPPTRSAVPHELLITQELPREMGKLRERSRLRD